MIVVKVSKNDKFIHNNAYPESYFYYLMLKLNKVHPNSTFTIDFVDTIKNDSEVIIKVNEK